MRIILKENEILEIEIENEEISLSTRMNTAFEKITIVAVKKKVICNKLVERKNYGQFFTRCAREKNHEGMCLDVEGNERDNQR